MAQLLSSKEVNLLICLDDHHALLDFHEVSVHKHFDHVVQVWEMDSGAASVCTTKYRFRKYNAIHVFK